jgi:hypothetical protein
VEPVFALIVFGVMLYTADVQYTLAASVFTGELYFMVIISNLVREVSLIRLKQIALEIVRVCYAFHDFEISRGVNDTLFRHCRDTTF